MEYEVWKPVPHYEGYYEISNTGRLRSVDKEVASKAGSKQFRKGTDITPGIRERGYKCWTFYKNGIGKTIDIHRLVAEVFIPNPENKPQVNHKDGNKLNNDVSNLEWVTNQENIKHAVQHKLHDVPSGTENKLSVLTADIVRDARKRRAKGERVSDLAKEYGVCRETLNRAVIGSTYQDITDVEPVRICLNRKPDKYSDIDVVQMGILRSKLSLIEIAKLYNTSVQQIHAAMAKHNVFKLYELERRYNSDMEYETTFQNEITASKAVVDNMFSYTRYNNIEILPSCVDGLKLCLRRIIGVLGTNDQRMKGATLTGEVMNKLHPHGDTGIYDAIVRLGQPFSQVLPFITIKGNCGAYGGGEYAASRYLDVQSAQFTKDIFFNNVDARTLTYIPSELGKGVEPAYYVPRLPTTLLTGSFGVSVAYKSVIPHLNFIQVCNMVEKFIEIRKKYPMNYMTKYEEIAEYCIPDFPTHCYIRNKQELIQHYSKGDFNTSILMDGMVEIGPYELNLRSLPHGLAFERVFKKVGDMMNSANFISANFTEVNDLTKGIEYGNIQFKMKRGVNPFEILEQFKKECTFTQTWTPIWIFVDKDGNVCRLNPMQLLEVWYLARHRSILGALKFQNIDLFKQYRKLMALIIIADHTDAVLKIFKEAENREATIPVLVKKFKLTREQAEYISSLQLHQITRQGKDDLLKNLDNVKERIENLQKKFVDIDGIILEDVAYLKKTYGPLCARRSELPTFIGAIHLVGLNGYIQFKNYQELAHLMRRWSKTQQVNVIMYPTGSYKLVRHVGKQVINDDLIDFPKEFYADRLEVCKLKPRVSVGLRNGTISRIEGVISFDKKSGILAHASGGLTVVDKAFKLRQVSCTDIPKRNSFEALGNKSDILYFNGTNAEEVVIAVVNDKNPNMVDLQRMKEGDSYRKLMLGHTEIIGMWKYGNPIAFTVPGRYLSRCGIKQVLIRNPEQFFENNTKVTIFMNKHRTSTEKNMVPLAKGVDILSESSIRGDKNV